MNIKTRAFVASVLLPAFVMTLVPRTAHARWNFQLFGRQYQDNSVNVISVPQAVYPDVDVTNQIFIDTKPLADAIDELGIVIRESANENGSRAALEDQHKASLNRDYNLEKNGPLIGVDLRLAETGTFARKYGRDVLQHVIQDRIKNLEISSRMSAEFMQALKGGKSLAQTKPSSEAEYKQVNIENAAASDFIQLARNFDGLLRGQGDEFEKLEIESPWKLSKEDYGNLQTLMQSIYANSEPDFSKVKYSKLDQEKTQKTITQEAEKIYTVTQDLLNKRGEMHDWILKRQAACALYDKAKTSFAWDGSKRGRVELALHRDHYLKKLESEGASAEVRKYAEQFIDIGGEAFIGNLYRQLNEIQMEATPLRNTAVSKEYDAWAKDPKSNMPAFESFDLGEFYGLNDLTRWNIDSSKPFFAGLDERIDFILRYRAEEAGKAKFNNKKVWFYSAAQQRAAIAEAQYVRAKIAELKLVEQEKAYKDYVKWLQEDANRTLASVTAPAEKLEEEATQAFIKFLNDETDENLKAAEAALKKFEDMRTLTPEQYPTNEAKTLHPIWAAKVDDSRVRMRAMARLNLEDEACKLNETLRKGLVVLGQVSSDVKTKVQGAANEAAQAH